MALIAMAVYDTEENRRTAYTERTFKSLLKTVDFTKHRLFVIDNNSCKETQDLYLQFAELWVLNKLPFENLEIIKISENIGTAEAINKAWRQRRLGEHCIKIDNDVEIHYKGWVEEMEEAIQREPFLGQIGLKRKDCWEHPSHENSELKSTLIMLPHVPGQRWIGVEKVKHVMGTCVMHNYALLDKVGYLCQPNLYGYDDVLMSWRSYLAGFFSAFLYHIPIDHIDSGDTPYQSWKERHAGQYSKMVSDRVDEYIAGKSLYHA